MALAAQLVAGPLTAAAADTLPGPPYIDHTSWVRYGGQGSSGLASLRVFPTKAGRTVAGDTGKTAFQADEAWREVLALAPDAGTPGMRAQFVCHWNFAEFAEPGKASWDLEPWRPVVDDNTMILTGCNPGGADTRF